MSRNIRIPSYRHHRPSGRAVVTLNGKDSYLGAYGSPESKAEYERVVAEWLARHQTPADVQENDGLALAEVMLAYLDFVGTYYRDADGNPTSEVKSITYALRPMEALYATTMAKDFGPVQLKAVRQKMIDGGLCRGVINQRVGILKRMFKW